MNKPLNPEVEILNAAVELPSGERGAYLDRACGKDAALRRQVEALLLAHDQAENFLESSPSGRDLARIGSVDFSTTEKPGDRIGRYKLLEQIGEGGCGVVYLAEQEEPVRRRVALKVIKLGMDTKSVIARFEAERQALALMEHPNIAKVFDAGATDNGRPYFVMELVRGVQITGFCDEHKLSTAERLKLFIQVCQAIQHAHQKGIIHRDIKPSNILVTMNDGVPVPKVIDFGIAKATQGRLTDQTVFTAFEQFIGTPAYMSPEQAAISSVDIDTRSDIYSLGVLLYELLTGRTPFDQKALLAGGLDEMRRTIREKEPVKPSRRVERLSELRVERGGQRPTSAGRTLNSQLKPLSTDLDWIVMKSLEKDRTRRYETANGLASDIQRHLDNEPVKARPPSRLYRFQKLVRRNKLASFMIVVVLVGLAVSTWLLYRENNAQQRALNAERAQQLLRKEREQARVDAAQQAAKEAEARGQLHQRQLLQQSQVARLTARSIDWSRRALSFADDAGKINTSLISSDVRDQAASTLAGLDARRIQYFDFGASSVLFDRDGRQLLMGSLSDSTRLWDGTTNAPFVSTNSELSPVAFVDDKTAAHLFYNSNRYCFTLSDMHSTQPICDWAIPLLLIPRLKFGVSPGRVVMTPDGSAAVAALELSDGNEAVVFFQAYSATVLREFTNRITSITISADGTMVAAAESNGRIDVWSLPSGHRIASLARGRNDVHCLALKSMQRTAEADVRAESNSMWLLAAGDAGGNVIIWDIQSNSIFAHCRGGHYQVSAIAFSPDGTTLASGGRGPVKLWDLTSGKLLLDVPTGDYITGLDFAPDGSRLAVSSAGIFSPANVSVWRLEFDRGIQTLRGLSGQIAKVAFSANGQRITALSHGWEAGVWEAATGKLLRVIEVPRSLFADNAAIALDPSGTHFAFAAGKTAKYWNIESGRELSSWDLPEGLVNLLVFTEPWRLLLFRVETLDGKVGPFSNANPKEHPRVCRIRELLPEEGTKPAIEIRDFNWHVFQAAAKPDGRCFVI